MIFKVSTYLPEKQYSKVSFYIQSKGHNAGRPLREPKRNSWVIETDLEFAFEICTMVWVSKKHEVNLCGSVIPFLRIYDFKKVLLPYLEASQKIEFDYNGGMKTLQNIDTLILQTQSKLKLASSLKISLATELLKKIDKEIP